MIRALLSRPAVATWAAFLLRALPLLLLPILISRKFDPAFLAFWMVLITIQGLQLLFESSLTSSFVRSFSYAMGGADRLRIEVGPPMQAGLPPNYRLLSGTWNTGALVYAGMAVLTGVVALCIGGWSGADIAASLPSDQAAWAALSVFAAGAALRAYGGLHLSYLYGVEQITTVRWCETGFWIIAFLATAIAVEAEVGILTLALVYQIPLALNIFLNMWLCRRDQARREGFVRAWRAETDIIAQLWPSVWRTGLGTFLYLGTTQGAGLYYATFGPPAEVAAYLFGMSLIRPLGQFAQVPFFTKVPILARLQASGERSAQKAIAQRSMTYSYVLHVVMVLGVAAVLPLMSGSQGEGLRVPPLLWLLIGLSGFLERIGGMHLQLYSSTNHILVHWANGLAALAFLVFAAGLFSFIEVYSFPIAQCLALIVVFLPIGMVNSYRAYALPFPSFELKTSVLPLIILTMAMVGAMI